MTFFNPIGESWIYKLYKQKNMNNYELKQGILDKMEIEGLIQKIQRLEKQLAEKELELKNMTREFISLQEEFYKD